MIVLVNHSDPNNIHVSGTVILLLAEIVPDFPGRNHSFILDAKAVYHVHLMIDDILPLVCFKTCLLHSEQRFQVTLGHQRLL